MEDFAENLDRKTIDRALGINGHPNIREGMHELILDALKLGASFNQLQLFDLIDHRNILHR